MSSCTKCGAGLGVGRFCVNCGALQTAPELDETRSHAALDETAVRPAVPGPLAPLQPVLPPAPVSGPRRRGPRRRTPITVWVLLGVLLLLVAVLGSCLAMGGTNGSSADDERAPASTPGSGTPEGSEEPDPETTDRASINLAKRTAIGDAPQPMPPSVAYGTGERVTYEATQMLDGDQETAYRLSGDASGTVITFDLGRERTLTAIGLINGYAKTSRSGGTEIDQYLANRRITVVEWTFSDGTTVRQELTDTREPQSLQLRNRPVTDTVELRIVEVSPPGTGRYRKDSTAISSVLLLGF